MKIVILLTCYNRREKTLACLDALYKARDDYNAKSKDIIKLSLYMTDDGCTDNTTSIVLSKFSSEALNIIQGDGSLYWAGGMRKAWKAAIKDKNYCDFYLLINDDTIVMPNVFDELLDTHNYSKIQYKKSGIYSGICCDRSDHSRITYGGSKWINKLMAKSKRLSPVGRPQDCDFTNANILLVSKEVVEKIGIFHNGFQHGCADYDYSIQVKKKGFPVLLTANVCGICDYDHGTQEESKEKVLSMSLKQRLDYFRHPLHSNTDYLLFIRRNVPMRYPMVWIGRFLNIYFPHFYYFIFKLR